MNVSIRGLIASLMCMATLVVSLVLQNPAMAMADGASTTTIATLSDKINARTKQAEGKLESAYGDLTGDTGRKVKGTAKQVQGSVMSATEAMKDSSRSIARGASDAADKLADKIN
ncbi:CsbD family protein [Synechococcus sp. CCY 9618]|uniref:CsbD family protein n=1 Tax=Synechococcus sp. CCY 9618 TaxID=2815602 RepID=UPI0020B1DD7B|nr:CsbD family protein [Synechococcus sp. CCY 9618]